MRTMIGAIALVQEGRFRLVGDDGTPMLFMLAHDAPVEPQDLPPLQAANARVAVRYTEAGSLIAGIAHDVVRLDRRHREERGI